MNHSILASLSAINEEERAILSKNTIDRSIYTDQRAFVIDRDKMLDHGKLIAIRPHTRFVDFPRHSHNYIEMMYVCQGSITHMIHDRQKVVVEAGELLFLNCHASHSIREASAEDIAVNFIMLPQFFDIAYEMMEEGNVLSSFIADNLRDSGGGLDYLHFTVANVLPVQNLIENLIWSIMHQAPNRKSINQTTMGLLFLTLLNHTDQLNFRHNHDDQHPFVIAVLKEIEENYQTASLGRLARELHQPMPKLSRLVKETTGKTFKEILQDKRFGKAAQLLRATRIPVVDIAQSVGYENMSYFHRQFHARYGVSPATYRRHSAWTEDTPIAP